MNTLADELPAFKKEMPLHFSKDGKDCFIRQEGDQNSYTSLEEIFQVLPKEQLI